MDRNTRNDMSYWWPRLLQAGVPVPRTQLVHTDVELREMLDAREPRGYRGFLSDLAVAARSVGLPCFLRTGQGSNKHDWARSCYLRDLADLPAHVANLVEWSELVDFFGLPCRTWAARELLPTRPAFRAFRGMPVTRERRYFFRSGPECVRVACHHPYWPRAAIEDPERPDWMPLLDALNAEPPEEVDLLSVLTLEVAKQFEGHWSLDWLFAGERGWIAIDMAVGEQSFHWPGCPASAG